MTDYNSGEWFGWNGGECPVHPDSMVEVMTGEGLRAEVKAKKVGWGGVDLNGARALVAFRVTKPYVEPKKPREWWLFGGKQYDSFDDATRDRFIAYQGRFARQDVPLPIHVREVLPD